MNSLGFIGVAALSLHTAKLKRVQCCWYVVCCSFVYYWVPPMSPASSQVSPLSGILLFLTFFPAIISDYLIRSVKLWREVHLGRSDIILPTSSELKSLEIKSVPWRVLQTILTEERLIEATLRGLGEGMLCVIDKKIVETTSVVYITTYDSFSGSRKDLIKY